MEKEDKSLAFSDELRGKRRDAAKEHQEFNRLKAFDSNRFVDAELISEQDVAGLCSRIKRRKHATAEDLRKLGNAFIQSETNISAFIKVTGAINILIKEFTGTDRNQQILAAQCICNLSLGDEVCCSKVANFAGSYLMIFIMKSNDVTFSRLCIWITQNIAAGGVKAIDVLMSQELLKNCLHILKDSVELEKEAHQLLGIIVDCKWSEIGADDKREVRKAVKNLLRKGSDGETLQLFYRVNDSESLGDFSESDSQDILSVLMSSLKEGSDEQVVHFAVKILSSMITAKAELLPVFMNLLAQGTLKLTDVINNAAKNPKLFPVVPDLLSFYAKLPDALKVDPAENLRIPKIFEF